MSVWGGKAAIVGVYASEQARSLPRTTRQVELECVKGALADAGSPTRTSTASSRCRSRAP
jgi:hypothetical protein